MLPEKPGYRYQGWGVSIPKVLSSFVLQRYWYLSILVSIHVSILRHLVLPLLSSPSIDLVCYRASSKTLPNIVWASGREAFGLVSPRSLPDSTGSDCKPLTRLLPSGLILCLLNFPSLSQIFISWLSRLNGGVSWGAWPLNSWDVSQSASKHALCTCLPWNYQKQHYAHINHIKAR